VRGDHRFLIFLGIVVFLAGCDNSPSKPVPAGRPKAPAYDPATFRDEITSLIAEQRFADAVHYLSAADPARQAQHDGEGYLAVAEDAIILPGVDPEVLFDQNRDWEFPGTSDAVLDTDWQQAATEFAEKYNRARRSETR